MRGSPRARRNAIVAFFAGASLAALLAPPAYGQEEPDPLAPLLRDVEIALQAGSAEQFAALTTFPPDDQTLRSFTDQWFSPSTTAAVLQERDRTLADDERGFRLLVEVLVQAGTRGRLATWRLDVETRENGWRITDAATLTAVDGLYRLTLDSTTQYHAENLVVRAEDLELHLPRGEVFVAEAGGGVTAAVLLGRGEMIFKPASEVERHQIALFAGQETLRAQFDGAYVRFNPSELASRLPPDRLAAVPVDPRSLGRAQEVLRVESQKAFVLDLGDLSRDTWSLLPPPGDFLAEVRTRRHGTLTYAHSGGEPEDIILFHRERRKHLSLYASRARLASRGRFYDEDDSRDYDILDHFVDVRFTPGRLWLDGTSRLKLRVLSSALNAITIRLADPLVVSSVTSPDLGRLLHVRVRSQNSIVVNLPATLTRGAELELSVRYGGRLEPQGLSSENASAGQQVIERGMIQPPEPSYIYSNRSYWYPQSNVSDYATATIRFTVPEDLDVVCSGEPATGSPVLLPGAQGTPRRLFVFSATQPVRYLACVASRLPHSERRALPLPEGMRPRASGEGVALRLTTTPRIRGRAREVLEWAEDIEKFYASILGDIPYPDLTVAALESEIPGGHAPAYMVALNQPLPTTRFVWREDPASFSGFEEFFIAHELAHQWWGQAVGWQNYHEQWLSEGLAQYFAALYAERARGSGTFRDVLRQLSHWAIERSDQGPVYLGYRLGHLQSDDRIFRALVYNKGAIVLHMLRQLLGDEAFFRGIRRFYEEHRFSKAGTDDLQKALEAESGHELGPFFEGWIFGQEIPKAKVRWHAEGSDVRVAVSQAEPAFLFPLPVTIVFRDGSRQQVVIPVWGANAEQTIPVSKPVRTLEINDGRTVPVVVD